MKLVQRLMLGSSQRCRTDLFVRLAGSFCIPMLMITASANAGEVVYPADAHIAKVSDFGAKGDGVTDDTQAILRACRANDSSQDTNNRIVYLSNGASIVTGTLIMRGNVQRLSFL
jgi:hypothetical protein